jgi:hypothetical protein
MGLASETIVCAIANRPNPYSSLQRSHQKPIIGSVQSTPSPRNARVEHSATNVPPELRGVLIEWRRREGF